MTGKDVTDARAALGSLWGFSRPLWASELGRALRLSGRDPGRYVLAWENGEARVSGPVSVAIELMLLGCLPPDGIPGR